MTTNAKNASKSKNRLGVVGKKLGMTQVFDEQGLAIPVTVIKVDPLTVTQVKTVETDGYNAIQVGFEPAKEKHLSKAQIGHFAKNGLDNFRNLQEFRVENSADKVGIGSAENSLFGGSVDASKTRSILVIILTPVVLESPLNPETRVTNRI